MIEIVRAPAHLIIQDRGFTGSRALGLPRAGAMDVPSLEAGNALVGNSSGAPGLEWAVTGGAVRFERDVTIALTGARVHGRIGQRMLVNDKPFEVAAGTLLEIDRFSQGRFLYLCLSPAPHIVEVFGSRSTYAPARIGGFQGRRLKQGDKLPLLGENAGGHHRKPEPLNYSTSTIRIVRGPQSDVLGGRLLSHLVENSFTISTASDRTGYRLEGPPADTRGLSQILSEPACEGAVQVTDGGTPIVLMADGPTIGGYNKIAVVTPADLPVLAQKNPGEKVRFTLK